MSRFFRLYEKKRGDRRTGSKAVGSLGEALFFGAFFVVGCGTFAYMIAALAWPEWRANRQFAETTCTVLAREVGQGGGPGEATTHRPELRIRYTVDGREYVEDEVYDVTRHFMADRQAVDEVLGGFEVGHEYPCWYDPIDPHRVVVARGYSTWLYVSLLIPLSFIIIGGGRLVFTLLHWSASDERRASLAQRAARLDPFETDPLGRHFPTVPADANLTNSPGTTLAYRLPIVTTAGWTLFAAATTCLLWNAIVALFVVMAARGFARGEPEWLLVLIIVPFVVAGIALLVYLIRQVMITTGVGPTRIEISAHPLTPGEPYDVFLSQAGRLSMNSLEVWLACDEKASFRQGTDTRTETRRVFHERCFVRTHFEILQGLPFESRCAIRVPLGAMHSFQANHNEVSWKLVVRGSVIGWPDYEREFQIVVNPAGNGHLHS